MIITRTIPGASQFDPADPSSGLFVFDEVPEGRSEITIKIENAGFSSDGPPHEIEIWLQPPGPIIAGGPKILVASSLAANDIAFIAGCVTPIPRDESVTPWTLRVSTSGKSGDGSVSIYYLLSGVTQ